MLAIVEESAECHGRYAFKTGAGLGAPSGRMAPRKAKRVPIEDYDSWPRG
jgi:hypothetical protein